MSVAFLSAQRSKVNSVLFSVLHVLSSYQIIPSGSQHSSGCLYCQQSQPDCCNWVSKIVLSFELLTFLIRSHARALYTSTHFFAFLPIVVCLSFGALFSYNGFPKGCSDDELPWGRKAESELDNKYLYVCHAGMLSAQHLLARLTFRICQHIMALHLPRIFVYCYMQYIMLELTTEMNAVLNSNSASVRGCTIYVTMFPCNNCTKLLLQAGVRLVQLQGAK